MSVSPNKVADVSVPPELLDAIHSLPTSRTVSHCGAEFAAPPFDIYATCPTCGAKVKVRSFAGTAEVEDVFDAVLAWMLQPGAEEVARRRQAVIAADTD
jgi:hypothetical protein